MDTVQSEKRRSSSSLKQFRLDNIEVCCGLQKLVRAMMLQGCRKADRAEVVERDRFATLNSLKSHGERNLLSPVEQYLCHNAKVVHAFEANTPFEKLPGTQINVPRLNLHKRPRHRRCPTSCDFVPWRFSDAGLPQRVDSLVMPASENLHNAQ